MIYLLVEGNLSIENGESAGYFYLIVEWHVGNGVPHYRALVAARHFCSFARRCGIVKEVIIRKQIVKEARIASLLCSQYKHIVGAAAVSVGKPYFAEVRSDIGY